MADLEKFEFNPKIGFQDGSAYPNPKSEQAVREQLFRSHKQTQTYINETLVPAIDEKTGPIIAGANVEITEKGDAKVISALGEGSGGSEKEYIDQQDKLYFEQAKKYTDESQTVTKVLVEKTDWILDEDTRYYYRNVPVLNSKEESCPTVYPFNPYERTTTENPAYMAEYKKLVKVFAHDHYITFVASTPFWDDIYVYVKGVGFDNEGRKHYKGSYTFTPKTTDQSIDTDEKIMDYDIKVEKVPYEETENEQGGLTAQIGEGE